MLSKSLIQFSADGQGCVPSLLFDLRSNYGGGKEDNGNLLQKVLFLGGHKLDRHAAAAAAKLLQSCPTLQPHRRQPTRLPRPWDSPGKNTGVCCHFLLQCMKVKSESEVAQSCLTLSNPMDCSLSGSSIHGIFWATVLELGTIAFSEIDMRGGLLCGIDSSDGRAEKSHSLLTASRRPKKAGGVDQSEYQGSRTGSIDV